MRCGARKCTLPPGPFLRSAAAFRSVRSLRSFVAPLVGHRRRCARGGSGRSVARRRSFVGARLRARRLRSVVRSSSLVRRCSRLAVASGRLSAARPLRAFLSLFLLSPFLPSPCVLACAPSSLSSSSLPSSLRLACSRRRRPPPPLLSRSVRSLRYRPRLRSETALAASAFLRPASHCIEMLIRVKKKINLASRPPRRAPTYANFA